MKKKSPSAMKTASRLILLWLAISLAGAFILGGLPDKVGRLPGLSVLALGFHLFCLSWVTHVGVSRIAVPEVPQWQRWVILALGVGLVSVSYLAVRQGAPLRSVWESLSTCGQILFVVVAAGYLPRFLKHPAELLPVISVMICSDVVSFLAGPTHEIAKEVAAYYGGGRQGVYPLSEVLLMKFATPGSRNLFPLFGVADWFMVVFLSFGARFFGLSDTIGRVPLAVLGLFLAAALAHLFDIFLPALPVLALFFIVCMALRYPVQLKPGKRELRLALLPPVLAVVVFFGKGVWG
ncbi:MAG: hypothetical protein MI742_10670 [Desulfobacterales bacterium]|nr:hypothetical protein [Desulfobacterales bacterium]